MRIAREREEKDLRRCEEALHSAETLFAEGLYAGSISRAYYAVIHAVILLLAEVGQETRRPEEAERLFTPFLITAEGLPSELWGLFEAAVRAKKAIEREDLIKYSGEDARELMGKGRVFLDLTREFFSRRR